MRISELADSLTTSPILTFAAEVNGKIAKGEKIHNLTVGDFDPQIYPIPQALTQGIVEAYQAGHTNYPGAFGLNNLRRAVQKLLRTYCEIEIAMDNILIASGSRPLIYGAYKSVLNPGDKVIYPVPSWNNDYYTIMSGAEAIEVPTTAANNFMPTKDELAPYVQDARLLALCSPQNPTGTVLSQQQLIDICDLVIAENNRRGADERPLYVMFDQVYWLLAFGEDVFTHALTVRPEIEPYAIFIDGLSKSFAGTGVRVGWATGPEDVIAKMRTLMAHIGAWAPKAEQFAAGEFLKNITAVKSYLAEFNEQLQSVLMALHEGFQAMRAKGLPVDSIVPEASIYLSVQMDLLGKTTAEGQVLENDDAVQRFLLEQANIAVLPFSWFGAKHCTDWYRISVGTCDPDTIPALLESVHTAISTLR